MSITVEGMEVDYVAESHPVTLTSARYDMGENQFTVHFNQKLGTQVTVYTVIPKISMLHGSGDNLVTINLASGSPGLTDADSAVVITLGLQDAQAANIMAAV